jgi:hypothetical protein
MYTSICFAKVTMIVIVTESRAEDRINKYLAREVSSVWLYVHKSVCASKVVMVVIDTQSNYLYRKRTDQLSLKSF